MISAAAIAIRSAAATVRGVWGRTGAFASAGATLLVLLLVAPATSLAELNVAGHGNVRYEYDSNVFALPKGTPTPGASFGDSSITYLGGLDATYLWQGQKMILSGVADQTRYITDTDLDRTEYTAVGTLMWVLDPLINGTARLSKERHVEPAYQAIPTNQLLIESLWNALATATYRFKPFWALDVSAGVREDDLPQVGAAGGLLLREVSQHAGLNYGNPASFTGGLAVEYLNGQFSGGLLADQLSYRQWSAEMVGQHSSGDLSTFNGALGYTLRTIRLGHQRSGGITGSIGYRRKLTGKTTVHLEADRAVATYLAAAGSEVDTSATADIEWQPTVKTEVVLGYVWMHSRFSAETTPFEINVARTDRFGTAHMEINYRPRKWLLVHPYVRLLRRSSDVPLFEFTSNIAGLELTAAFP